MKVESGPVYSFAGMWGMWGMWHASHLALSLQVLIVTARTSEWTIRTIEGTYIAPQNRQVESSKTSKTLQQRRASERSVRQDQTGWI